MKKMFFLLVLVGLFGCQQEEFSVVAEEEENTESVKSWEHWHNHL